MHSADEASAPLSRLPARIQINLMTQQTNALIARIVENMDHQLLPSVLDAQVAPSAVRRVPYQSTPGLVQQPLATILRYWLGLQNGELSLADEIDQQSRIHGESQQGLGVPLSDWPVLHSRFHRPARRAEALGYAGPGRATSGRATLRDAAFEICIESSTMCRDNAR